MKPGQSNREKWGVPDWRKGSKYPKTLTSTLWRWEFLRRSEEYRRDWLRYAPKTLRFYRKYSPKDLPKFDLSVRSIFPDNWGCNDINDARFRAFMPGSIEKYGLTGLVSPRISKPASLRFQHNAGRLHLGPVKLKVPAKHCAFLIDLTRTLDEQISSARMTLLAWQSHLGMPRSRRRRVRHLWPLYLRALDAEAEEITNENFYTTVYPRRHTGNPRARGREIFGAARKLQTYLVSCTI